MSLKVDQAYLSIGTILRINDEVRLLWSTHHEMGFALWYNRLEKAKFTWPTQEKNQVNGII
ncbi:TPA: hypothetical protein GRI57_19190 [Vibrio parahaemolyticus]|uniref:IS66 family insertion sequence element accessory protein TnpB n=1 Tax=Vibrio parahaemolyticus TaxID=670 RepID=UPI0012AE36CF|nr:IS66 family insertion sequence element accessory protein TnpB [Vibrio parahaemolyticus]HAS6725991.1 hypothetical protein [Vibrio parahaemolyticus]HAS6783880.1 hypothetical protein [Vibrio parahaemolyticus]HAS6793745.1 hypothetical protein [Vibrio parahaemolyticus]HAS6882437.1 hypothetical protein [Vibrio parahaemolyticus]HAS6896863.1 hypothetical protein [Vibrio parahaemolyticus]